MKKNNIFWGSLFILTAILIILDSFGYLYDIGTLSIVFTCLFSAIAIKGIFSKSITLVIFPLSFIVAIFREKIGIDASIFMILLVALLLTIGLKLIFSKKAPNSVKKSLNFEKIKETLDENCINYSVSFGSAIKYVNTNDFRNVDIDCSFGSAKVYFDNAVITENSAKINIDVSFGSVELFIPKNWHIVNNIENTLSSIIEKTQNSSENGPTVYLYGDATFSSINIYYI